MTVSNTLEISWWLRVSTVLDLLPYHADYLIGGGWTASIVPEAHRTLETTGGTVLFMDIPKDRKDIWEKFDPQNYPAWAYRQGEVDEFVHIHAAVNRQATDDFFRYFTGGNFTGGFPITKEGRLKFVFRGCKVQYLSPLRMICITNYFSIPISKTTLPRGTCVLFQPSMSQTQTNRTLRIVVCPHLGPSTRRIPFTLCRFTVSGWPRRSWPRRFLNWPNSGSQIPE